MEDVSNIAVTAIQILVWVGFAWSQISQIVPPSLRAKLPSWMLAILSYLEANKGYHANQSGNDPKILKAKNK